MARARDEKHRFDGQAEKVEVDADRAGTAGPDVQGPRPASDNARQAARAARIRAARSRQPAG